MKKMNFILSLMALVATGTNVIAMKHTMLTSLIDQAMQDNVGAQYHLGYMYHHGRGVEQNYEEAIQWYRRAADNEHAIAQYDLGCMYENGLGVEQDYTEAIRWYKLAADNGNALARYNLGSMYEHGHGVEQDLETANYWYRLAANQGHARALNHIEMKILTGEATIEYIGREEFHGMQRRSIELVDTREIGIGAFECSPNLEQVTIKSFSRPSIRAFAFGDCPNLRLVEFFGLPGEIASNAFGEHQNNGISPEFLDTRIIIHGEIDEEVHQQLLNAGIREENIEWPLE